MRGKTAANLAKHGVDFRDAIGIFRTKTVEWPDREVRLWRRSLDWVGLNEEQEIFVVNCEEDEASRHILSARKANTS